MIVVHVQYANVTCNVYNFAGVFTLLVEDFGKQVVKLFNRLLEIIIH